MRDATIISELRITETCQPGSGCRTTTSEHVTLMFVANDTWSALGVAAREAGVEIGLLMETYLSAGLSLAGYALKEEAA